MIRERQSYALATTVTLLLSLCWLPVRAAAADDDDFRLWVDPIDIWILEKDQDTKSSQFEEYRDLSSGLWAGLGLFGESADGGDRNFAVRLHGIGREDARYTFDYRVEGSYAFSLDYNQIPHRFGNDAGMPWDRPVLNQLEFPDPVQGVTQEEILAFVATADRIGLGLRRDRTQARFDRGKMGKMAWSVDYSHENRNGDRPLGVAFGFGNVQEIPEPIDYETTAATIAGEFPDPVQGVTQEEILAFVATADRIGLGLRRDRTQARFDRGKMGKMAWSVDYSHENRNGDRPLGVAFGFGNVQEIPEPINYETTAATIAGEFNSEQGGVRLGYTYSTFENNFGSVVWDNPFNAFEAAFNPSRGRFDLAPDNEAGLFFVEGRARAGGWWFSGNAGYNTLSQDDTLLPYTINTGIEGVDTRTGATFPAASAGLPVTRADNEAEVLNLSANAGTSFGDDWTLTFRYRYYDYDNTSPRIEFPGYVRLDERWEEDRLITVPYSYGRDSFGAELGWDATDTTSLSLAYTMESWDRQFREITDSDEDIVKLSLDSRPSDKVTVRASWATGDRSIGAYRTEAQLVFFVDPHGIDNLPGLRKFDQAERDVDDYEISVQLFPTDAWNVSFGLSGRDESYGKSEFGLVSDELFNYNFELGYTPGANLNFYLFGHNEDRDVFQRNRQSGRELSTNPADNWTAAFVEDTMTWGLGLSSESDSGWSWDLAVHLSDSDGEIDFETPPEGSPSEAVDIGNYEDIELLSAWVKVRYQFSERISCGGFYLYEDYSIDSFIRQGLQPFIAGTLLLIPNDGDYQAHLFGVNMRVIF